MNIISEVWNAALDPQTSPELILIVGAGYYHLNAFVDQVLSKGMNLPYLLLCKCVGVPKKFASIQQLVSNVAIEPKLKERNLAIA